MQTLTVTNKINSHDIIGRTKGTSGMLNMIQLFSNRLKLSLSHFCWSSAV